MVARSDRSRRIPRLTGRRWVAVLLVVALFLPVPWMHVVSDDPPGTAWRLDGRLEIEGRTINPPGRWSWLAVGRPQLVGEIVRDRLFASPSRAVDLRTGPVTRRPALSEPAAVAVGLRQAGRKLPLGVVIEVRDPLLEGYPETGLLEAINGAPLTDRRVWDDVVGGATRDTPTRSERPSVDVQAGDVQTGRDEVGAALDQSLTFRFRSGRRFTAPGPGLPYAEVIVSPTAPDTLTAGITFAAARLVPGDYFRNLSVGSSHGMMVALMAYVDASQRDLAQGRHIAGTGGVLGDGSVVRVGGLTAKAQAANRAGADVLLVPRTQVRQLDDVPLPGTTVVPVTTLAEAIEWLAVPVV